MTSKITMSGIFNLLEKLGMNFPSGKSALDAKMLFKESTSFVLTNSTGDKQVGS